MTRVLVVANRTAATPTLLAAVRSQAEHGPASFHLVVPASPHGLHRIVDPEDNGQQEAEASLRLALPLISEAAGHEVEGHVGDPDPLAAIHDALHAQRFDQIIISTLPSRLSRWMRLDLPSKARACGVPVLHVEAAVEVSAAA